MRGANSKNKKMHQNNMSWKRVQLVSKIKKSLKAHLWFLVNLHTNCQLPSSFWKEDRGGTSLFLSQKGKKRIFSFLTDVASPNLNRTKYWSWLYPLQNIIWLVNQNLFPKFIQFWPVSSCANNFSTLEEGWKNENNYLTWRKIKSYPNTDFVDIFSSLPHPLSVDRLLKVWFSLTIWRRKSEEITGHWWKITKLSWFCDQNFQFLTWICLKASKGEGGFSF